MRLATACAPVAGSSGLSPRFSSRITNSSPPSRATVSPLATQERSRSATSCSSMSPFWWPSVSLSTLKLSRSMNISAPFARSGRIGQRGVQPVHQQLAVGQLGQRVVEGQVLDLLFGELALGDVAADRHPVGQLALPVPDRRHVQVHPERLAVLAVVDQVHPRRAPLLHRRADAIQCRALRVRALQQPRRAADHFVARVAGAPLERIVDEHDARAGFAERSGLGDDDDVVEPRDAAFEQPELFLRLAAAGDVAQVQRHAAAERKSTHLEPVRQARIEFLELQLHAARTRAAELLLQPQPHRLLERVPEATAQQLLAAGAQQALGLLVQEAVLAVAVDGHEGFAAAQCRAHAQQRSGAQPARRDLLHRALDRDDPPILVTHRLAERPDPGAAAVGQHDLRFLVERGALHRAGAHQLLHPRLEARRVVAASVIGGRRIAGRLAVDGRQLVRPDQRAPGARSSRHTPMPAARSSMCTTLASGADSVNCMDRGRNKELQEPGEPAMLRRQPCPGR